ncbi:peroxiredoxin [Mesorhizobium sp. LHD-90]|uniref:peroxiredoxin n=1 Tax=Mesorhizobium sp. LHD-90 TaxID=3071414 RepID=UPI0027DF80A2|nr:peroxiredoxin [Mesorhizobium sp. LHD-90]MDQ6437154.1 peroxiredoxin [Mesorhizobium sp. LHD-90]
MAELAEGDIAPDIVLPRGSGGTISLSGLKGKKVVLYFYPKDDTQACTAEAIDFSALKRDFEAAGAVVVGVSPDNPKKHGKFAAKHAISIDLASDEDLVAANAYGVWVEKSMYGRRYMGVERCTFLIGTDGRIRRIWRKVRVRGHAAEVLAAVRDLGGDPDAAA